MPLIKQDVLLGIADRVAAQYKLLKEAMDRAVYGQDYHTRVNDTGDVDVQIPLLAPYVSADKALTIATLVKNFTPLGVVVSSMNNHFAACGNVGSWDGYLRTHDVRVSDYFNQVYNAAGLGCLLAVNVFCEEVLTFATMTIRSSGMEYVDGDDFGPGMNVNLRANGRDFAAQRLKMCSDEPVTADVDFMVSLRDWQGDVYDVSVSMHAGETEVPIGSNEDRFMDVVNVTLAEGGNSGGVGDVIYIKNVKDREVSL